MQTIQTAFYQLKAALLAIYDEREATAVAHDFVGSLTGMSRTQRLINKDVALNDAQLQAWTSGKAALVAGKPLQQVLHSAWFLGREYYVNEHVLIPRPETEELVQWIVSERTGAASVVDIGTGSGCIPISLKLAMPGSAVTAIDVSADALQVAERNARQLKADVELRELDFLDIAAQDSMGIFDVIVSNPPYIPLRDMDTLHANVRDHEPHLALFVPNNDALLFYRHIALFGLTHLSQGGAIYCELDAAHASQAKQLFEQHGYTSVTLRKDLNGNWRMLKAER